MARISKLSKKEIYLILDEIFPTSRHLSYGIRYRFYKQFKKLKKTKSQNSGYSLAMPHPDNDKKFLDFYIELKNKPKNRFFRNRFLHCMANIHYPKLKGNDTEKYVQMNELILRQHPPSVWKRFQIERVELANNRSKEHESFRELIRNTSRIVMLMGENIFLFNELDGFIRNTSGKKLNSGNSPLQELFHAHFNIDEELLKKLTRKTKTLKDKIGRQKKGRVDREQWKVGRKKKIIVSKVIPIRD